MSDDDAAYLAAVEQGDMATAARMVEQAARTAGFGVGPVYHGTDCRFTAFDQSKIGRNHWQSKEGLFFSEDCRQATSHAAAVAGRNGEAVVMAVYLKIENPRIASVDSDDRSPADYYDDNCLDLTQSTYRVQKGRHVDLIDFEAPRNHDGIVVRGTRNDSLFVVFDPAQIKSADPVCYDESGQVVPLSLRFGEGEDIRGAVHLVEESEGVKL